MDIMKYWNIVLLTHDVEPQRACKKVYLHLIDIYIQNKLTGLTDVSKLKISKL